MTERAYLPAVAGPMAAWVIARDYPHVLREWEARGRTLRAGGQAEAGQQLLFAVASIRESGRQRIEGHRAELAGESEDVVEGGWLSAEAAGLQLEVGSRQVINLVKLQTLTGRKVQGRWEVDEVSVVAERQRRIDDGRLGA